MPKLLVVDDEPTVLYSITKAFRSDTLEVLTAQTGRQALEMARKHQPDVVILDVRLSDMSGLEVFDRLREIDARLPVIVITAYAATETAIEAMKRGAYEYLLKPLDVPHLRELVQRALELSRFRHVPMVFDEGDTNASAERIVGRSAAMQEVYKAIGRVAPSDVTVLIAGESGTGKELVARALWHHSGRADKTFLAINCAAIPETLLESELFGHEKGAFTGAERRRIGRFEQANGGTLLLDEVSDMTAGTQAKLLRVLQEHCFERVGGEETIWTDVRLLAATNKDLEKEVSAGRFRSDLFYRLNVFAIQLPPLRDRRDDIPLLTDHLMHLLARTLGRNVYSISPEVAPALRGVRLAGQCPATPKCAQVRHHSGVGRSADARLPSGDPSSAGCRAARVGQCGPAARHRGPHRRPAPGRRDRSLSTVMPGDGPHRTRRGPSARKRQPGPGQ